MSLIYKFNVCPSCNKALTVPGKCWNPACKLAGTQVTPLSEAKETDVRKGTDESITTEQSEPLRIQLITRDCEYDDQSLSLYFNRRPSDDDMRMIQDICNLSFRAKHKLDEEKRAAEKGTIQ